MLTCSLAILLASALATDLTPEQLVERLGSPDRVIREEAARTLEERGTDALPTLRAARDAAGSQDARGTFSGLIDRIETRLLDRPTLVKLDLDDRPLGDAVLALATASGFTIKLDDPALASRRIAVRAPSPLPFWEALDRLGRAGHVRHDPGPRRDAHGEDREASTIRLVDGDPPAFTAYSGPLRIHLFATHRHRDISFEAATASRAVPRRATATVTVEVQAFAEPDRFLDPNGLPRIEAIDGSGRALSPAPGGGAGQPDPFEHSWLVPGWLSLLHWHVPLGLPDPPVPSPLKLRGTLPVVISSREPGPLDIPLAGASGKTFHRDACAVRVENIARGGQSTVLSLVLGDGDGDGESEGQPGRGRGRSSEGPQEDDVRDSLRHRLAFEDAEGHPLHWLPPRGPQGGASREFRVQVFVAGPAPPARLRVYRLRRLATEIRFECDDVPPP
jgi:hypothetical protein